MAITYPLAWPSHERSGLAKMHFRQRKVIGMNVAPTSLVPQIIDWVSAERWDLDITVPTLKRAAAEPFVGMLLSLNGPVGSFTVGDPLGATSRGAASGSVTAGGTLRNRTITLSGGSGALLAGDWISLSSHRWLHKIVKDVTLTGGAVTAEIWPGLRATVSSAPVAIAGAMGTFMLTQGFEWEMDANGWYPGITFSAIEDLRP